MSFPIEICVLFVWQVLICFLERRSYLLEKINIDGEAITYEKKSDLAGYMITLHECQQISNFVYQGNFQLMSVLWLLSEFALTKFL